MKRVTINGLSYAVPFEKLFRPLTDAELSALKESVALHGVLNPVVVYTSALHGRAVIDGANRAALSEGREVPVLNMGEIGDDLAQQWADTLNAARRHLSVSEQEAAHQKRKERLARVGQMRRDGFSMRRIATLEGISVAQAHADVEDAEEGVQGGLTPESVTGEDGKRYPARKPPPEPETPTEELPGIELTTDPARIDAAELRYLQEALDGVGEAITVLLDLKGPRAERLREEAKRARVPLSGSGWPALDAVRGVVAAAAS